MSAIPSHHTIKLHIDGRPVVATYQIARFEWRPGTYRRMVESVAVFDEFGRSLVLSTAEMDKAWAACEDDFTAR